MSGQRLEALRALHTQVRACEACPNMIRPVVHGAPVLSKVLLIGQAPGIKEGPSGMMFAWTAGKTLFRWFHQSVGADEATVRARVYFAAVAKCFPGKASHGGGDRKPDATEVANCSKWLKAEVQLVRPALLLPVGALAIEQVLGHTGPLKEVVGTQARATFHGLEADVIALPHPSGASTWHITEPGKTLLARALELVGRHPVMRELFLGAKHVGE